jgi:hypothetical protein
MLLTPPSYESEIITHMRPDPDRAVTPEQRETPLDGGHGHPLPRRSRAGFAAGKTSALAGVGAIVRRSWHPSERILRPARHGALIALAVYLVLLGSGHLPLAVDAHAYWSANPLTPYRQSQLGDFDAYFYSPAFAQALWPLTRLPWSLFAATWTGILVAALYVQAGRWFGLVVPLVAVELAMGNIHLLIGLAIAAGLVWPAAWAFPLLTKVTPGVGLLWFAVRRERRPLATTALATAAVVVPSLLLNPGAWVDWVRLVMSPLGNTNGIYIPLAIRLPVAATVIAWGARTDRRWTVVVGSWLAFPALWWNSAAVLVALIPVLDSSVPLARLASSRRAARAHRSGSSGETGGTTGGSWH